MSFTLHSWSLSRHPGTSKTPAYARVHIRGRKIGLFGRQWKSETYTIPLSADSNKNTNKELVKHAISLSANKWSIPWGLNFK